MICDSDNYQAFLLFMNNGCQISSRLLKDLPNSLSLVLRSLTFDSEFHTWSD